MKTIQALMLATALAFSAAPAGCGGTTPPPDGQAVAGWIRVGAAVAVQLAELAADLAELWSKCSGDPAGCALAVPPPPPPPDGIGE